MLCDWPETTVIENVAILVSLGWRLSLVEMAESRPPQRMKDRLIMLDRTSIRLPHEQYGTNVCADGLGVRSAYVRENMPISGIQSRARPSSGIGVLSATSI